MTTKTDGALAPADVPTKVLPATSATSDLPVVTAPVMPPAEVGTKAPDGGDPAAKSGEGNKNPDAGDGKTAAPDGTKSADGEGAAKKPKPGISERMSEITAQRRAAEDKARNEESARLAADARADKLEKDLKTALEAINKVVPPAPEDVRPTRAQFDDPDKYDAALSGWAERMGAKKAKADAEAGFQQQRESETKKAEEDRQRAEAERVGKDWQERSSKFVADNPDFEDVIKNDNVQITPTMGQAILYSELGPKIAYHLGKNPEEAARIAALPPAKQLMALGALETTLSAPPKTTNTPVPIEPITSGRSNAAGKTPHEESMDEYAARRSSELRSKSGART